MILQQLLVRLVRVVQAIITTADNPQVLEYGIDMKNGIIVNNATAGHDLTIIYKPSA